MTPEEDTDLIIYNQVVKDVTKPIVMEQLKQMADASVNEE
jgi:hypothetical protein